MMIAFENSREFARAMDESDELKDFRNRFYIPKKNGKEKIYFTGNSLGLQPVEASNYLKQELNDWAEMGGEGHFEAKHPWYSYHEIFSRQLADITGAHPGEVVVMNSLTVNLHLLLISFYRPTANRYKIICEYKAFPSDQYVFESQVRLHGLDPQSAIIEVKPRPGSHIIEQQDIENTIREHGNSVALVIFGGINYYTGQVFDIKKITETAHSVGAYAGFDLAHAAGNISLRLHEWNVDFGCWCTYKYLNAGPGSVGGAFIHSQHAVDTSLPRLAGWWGHNKDSRFKMEKGFDPMPTAEGWQLSNAPVFSMAVHKAALDLFEEAGMPALVNKGLRLSGYLIFILKEIIKNNPTGGIQIITPENENARGCQVSFIIPGKGKRVFDYLMENGVSAGWREPEVIRVAPVPLYNSFSDVWMFGQLLKEALDV